MSKLSLNLSKIIKSSFKFNFIGIFPSQFLIAKAVTL